MDLGLARPVESGRNAPLRSGADDITASASVPPVGGSGESPNRALAKVTRLGAIAGTPAYMAPEQYLRGDADAKSDQYSFCVTLFESLFGLRPYDGASLHELAQKIVEGRMHAVPRETAVPRWLQDIVMRGLRVDPEQRFAAMTDLVAELTRVRRRTGRRVGVLAGGLAAAVIGWNVWADAREDPCRAAGEPMTDVWNEARRAQIEAAFAATGAGWADDTAARAFAKIDEYASAWTAMRLESCRAAVGRDAALAQDRALRDACLDERLGELGAWLDVLAAADRKLIERAVGATSALSAIGQCADRAYLTARQRPWRDREVGDQVAELRTRLPVIKALERAGRYEEGTTLAREVVAEAEAMGERPLMAEAEYRLGEVQQGAGKYAEAEATLTAAFADARWSRHELIAIDAASLLAYVVGVSAGRHDDALLWARIAEAELGPTGQDTEAHASLLNNLGNIHAGKADYPVARDHLERAIAIATALHGPDHLLVAKYRGNLVPVLTQLGGSEDAITMGTEVLRIYREQLGPDHPYVGIAHNNLCSSVFASGDADTAVDCFAEVLGEHERALGKEHPQVALTLNNLGAMLHVQGRDEEAYGYLVRARKGFDVALPADHPHVAGLEVNLGACALALGRHDEAVEHLQRALDVRTKTLAPGHRDVLEARAELADALAASGRHADALAELEQAIAAAQDVSDRDEGFVARIRARRGLVWASMGKPSIAARELTQALAALGEAGGEGDVVGRSHLALARLHWEGGRKRDARTSAALAIDAFRRLGGRGRAGLAEAEQWLAAHDSE